MDLRILRFFIRIAALSDLLGGLLLYALGVGIARYLGNPIDWALVSLGQVWVTTLQLGAHFLTAHFTLPGKPRDPTRIPIPGEGEKPHEGIRRDLILWAGFASFAAAISLSLILLQYKGVNGGILIVMGLIFVGVILYAVPPFQWVNSGYGELVHAIILVNLIPALGFMFQEGELHRLVTMSTFPLTMLYLAMMLAIQFQDYHKSQRTNRGTLLVRLGWERGMVFHNLLILGSFFLMGAALFFGLPSSVALPGFFVFPLGLFQIWMMSRIAAGAKPNWRVLNLTAVLTFGLTTYLIAFSFWIR